MQKKVGNRDDQELNLVFAWKASNRNVNATILSLLICLIVLAVLVFVTEIIIGAKKGNVVTNQSVLILPPHKELPQSIQSILNRESLIKVDQENSTFEEARYAAQQKLKSLTKIDKNYRSSLISLPQHQSEMDVGFIDIDTNRSIPKLPKPMPSYELSSFEELELSVRFFTEDEVLNDRISFDSLSLDDSFFMKEGVYHYTLGVNSQGHVIHCLPMQRGSKDFDAVVRKYLKNLKAKSVAADTSEQWALISATVEWGEAHD